MLKGNNNIYVLALWSDVVFSYSLNLSDGISENEWSDIISEIYSNLFKQYIRVVYFLLQPFDLLQLKKIKAVSTLSFDNQCLLLLFYDPYGNRTHDFTVKAVSTLSFDNQCLLLLFYDPYGNRTHDFTVRG